MVQLLPVFRLRAKINSVSTIECLSAMRDKLLSNIYKSQAIRGERLSVRQKLLTFYHMIRLMY